MADDDTASQHPRQPRVSDVLTSFTWSDDEYAAYEAALHAVDQVVGACSARIAQERARPEPDVDAIVAWRTEQGRCVEVRRGLDPSDHAAVARVREEYSALAKQLSSS